MAMRSSAAEVRVEKRFRHPVERVFDAFLDPAHVGLWLFHTPDGVTEKADYDPRPGGDFALFERRGGDLVRHFGRFVEIERPSRILFDFRAGDEAAEPTRVTVTFSPEGDGCQVILSHDLAPAWAVYAGRSAAGWSMILENLVATMESVR
ncbi:hypothetical protein BH10PSE1_BH10PSE1_25460 [soil metagenome]